MKTLHNKNLILSFLALFISIIVASTAVYAYYRDVKTTTNTKTMIIGNVKYEFEGELISGTPIVPSQNIINLPVKLNNKSSVLSELKIEAKAVLKILSSKAPQELSGWQKTTENNYTYFTIAYKNLDNSGVSFGFADGWVFNEIDNCYYYQGTKATPKVIGDTTHYQIPAPTEQHKVAIEVLNSLVLDGSIINNRFKDCEIIMRLTFYAKQAEFLNWNALDTIDFS